MTNTWQEEAFDERVANGPVPDTYGLLALDKELERLGGDIAGLAALIGERTATVSTLRRRVGQLTGRVDLP